MICFDAIVVGSGPGGATVSRGLAEHGWRVLILEMGAHHRVTGGMAQTIRELWLVPCPNSRMGAELAFRIR